MIFAFIFVMLFIINRPLFDKFAKIFLILGIIAAIEMIITTAIFLGITYSNLNF